MRGYFFSNCPVVMKHGDGNYSNDVPRDVIGLTSKLTFGNGTQLRHIPGHNNYIPGRSILKADPEELAKQTGTGVQVGEVPRGQPGFKERINFGTVIGDYVKDGVATETTNGIMSYAKDGSIHIVPAAP